MNQEKSKWVLQTLKRHASQGRRSLNELRVIIALERAIARLESDGELANHLVFKGGFVLLKNYDSARFTRDADALAMRISKEKLQTLACAALVTDLNDGLWYGNVKVEDLEDQGDYGSFRFDCAFQIGVPEPKKIHKLSRIHIDIGLSDKLPTLPRDQIMPSILDEAEPVSWKVYPIEFIVAEKLETVIARGSANSRAKDIFDLVTLLPLCPDTQKLTEAIAATFANRKTALPSSLRNAVDEIDVTILEAAWGGVQIQDEKVDFNEIWRRFLKVLMDRLD